MSDKRSSITRIYQAGVLSAAWKKTGGSNASSPMEALKKTHALFQDAVNYHLLALAGMACRQDASNTEKPIGVQFREALCSIWRERPQDNPNAETLQTSVCRTLGKPDSMEFDEAVSVLFEGCEHPELLPYVQQYIMDKMEKGEAVIQQEGRSLLPKLCDSRFGGNFDFSPVQMKAAKGLKRVEGVLFQETIDEEEVRKLAAEMDLSWVGIKTQTNSEQTESVCWTSEETRRKVSDILTDLENHCPEKWKEIVEEEGVNGADLFEKFSRDWENRSEWRLLAKNNKANPELRNAAVLLQYFPCRLTAKILKTFFKEPKKESPQKGTTETIAEEKKYEYRPSQSYGLKFARGVRGYIYPGWSALPSWGGAERGEMREKQWDILAFKEALKCLHGFELKTKEREQERGELQGVVDYMEGKTNKAPKRNKQHQEEDDEEKIPVLGGDPRYELLQELLESFKGEDDEDYSLFVRALKGWEKLKEKWEKKGSSEEAELRKTVISQRKKIGSSALFLKLCEKKYQLIWRKEEKEGGKRRGQAAKRSEDVLSDFAVLQKRKWKLERLQEPVRVSAADPVYSPRSLNFSEWKGAELFKSKSAGMIDLPVLERNDQGAWETTFVRAKYAAPRMVRDELGVDPGGWGAKDSCSWLQPMMAALGLEAQARMEKNPAVFLALGSESKPGRCPLLLNFPVQLDVEDVQKKMGKRDRWRGQLNGVKSGAKSERLHLLWPGEAGKEKKDSGKQVMPWWEREEIKKDGFSCLGVDLGVRAGSAYSLVEVRPGEADRMASKSGRTYIGRFLGQAGGQVWRGFPVKQGVLRLAGEGGALGVARKATKDDKRVVQDLRKELGDSVEWGGERGESILDVQSAVLFAAERYLKRFRAYVRCIRLFEEGEADMWLEVEKCFSEKGPAGWWEAKLRYDKKGCLDILLREVEAMKRAMPNVAERIMNVILPRKKGQWKWLPLEGKERIGGGRMELQESEASDEPEKKVLFQGGLSMSRINVLEQLRRVLQSMSRLLAEAGSGRSVSRVPVEDACPILLEKINRMREQRVNRIAHDIVAQALGVRLKEEKSPDKKDSRIYHGEYEKIPGRRPVDFVVLENLSRYRTKSDRPREENSMLMQWSHRQIALKITQMLEEVFGIPVLFAHAAYTSRFDCMTSAPGFRPQAMTPEQLKKMADSEEKEEREKAEKLARLWLSLQEELPKKLTLYMPHPSNGGEYFVSSFQGKISVRQADINAAVNIAWRGLASHEALELLHRLRLEKKGSKTKLRRGNVREKALRPSNGEDGEIDAFEATSAVYVAEGKEEKKTLDRILLDSRGRAFYFAEPKEFWGKLKQSRWKLCHQLNMQVLRRHLGDREVDNIERWFGREV